MFGKVCSNLLNQSSPIISHMFRFSSFDKSVASSLSACRRDRLGRSSSQERAAPFSWENHSPLLLVSLEVRNKLLSPASGESWRLEMVNKIYSIYYDFILDIGIVLY